MDPQIQGNFFLQSFKSTHFVSEMLTVISLRDRTRGPDPCRDSIMIQLISSTGLKDM